jgi:uncharacterized Zn finger protein
MARQTKKDERARTFPAFEPRPGRGPFADSWWGQAWIDALEETSLDSGRLSRGRTYARRGDVADITVRPGRVDARVHGSQPTPYRVTISVTELDDAQWDRLLDTVAARATHIAALLDGDMPPELVDDAKRAGVRLLPAVGDIEPGCSCPDWGWPCKHAAALCYQAARLLDLDPFVLLLMRGRGEHELMDELLRRNTRRTAAETAVPTVPVQRTATSGVPARDAFASWRPPSAPLPVPEPVTTPGTVPMLTTATPPDGIDPEALEILATDAAARAAALLDAYLTGTEPAPVLPDTSEWQDAVRLATAYTDVRLFARLCRGDAAEAGRLALAVRAWRHGGPTGLDLLGQPWSPPAADLARARAALELDEETPIGLRTWRNRWTWAELGAQLRYGPDGRWYPYRQEDGVWWPSGPADPDPTTALASLLD